MRHYCSAHQNRLRKQWEATRSNNRKQSVGLKLKTGGDEMHYETARNRFIVVACCIEIREMA